VNGQLHVAEHYKRADIQIVGNLAQRQLPFQTGYVDFISHFSIPPEYVSGFDFIILQENGEKSRGGGKKTRKKPAENKEPHTEVCGPSFWEKREDL
jgi:hypothetical protein